jgi:hypothetical protein
MPTPSPLLYDGEAAPTVLLCICFLRHCSTARRWAVLLCSAPPSKLHANRLSPMVAVQHTNATSLPFKNNATSSNRCVWNYLRDYVGHFLGLRLPLIKGGALSWRLFFLKQALSWRLIALNWYICWTYVISESGISWDPCIIKKLTIELWISPRAIIAHCRHAGKKGNNNMVLPTLILNKTRLEHTHLLPV